ncbi:MAG: hypothetical protein ABIR70_15970 [Bryobacteraceae bacterium]
MKRFAALIAFLLLAACGRYSDFTLPAPQASGPAGPFQWQSAPNPVIERGEAADVLNPSVVRFYAAYWNFYSEFDGKSWHTAAATSTDGHAWTKQGRVLSAGQDYIAANGSALVVGDEILYWYETGYPLRLALARSRDGKQWTRQGVVLETGPYGSFDERAVADPYVIRAGEHFYLYYLGQDRAARQRLGVARSTDGVTWEKLRANPVLEGVAGAFDEELGEPAVWNSGGAWWMLYTGRARDEQRRIGLARSADGIAWTRVPDVVIAGDQGWNSKVVADPTVEVQTDGAIRVWFGGGDVASPDQNLHGQIGVGVLRQLQ